MDESDYRDEAGSIQSIASETLIEQVAPEFRPYLDIVSTLEGKLDPSVCTSNKAALGDLVGSPNNFFQPEIAPPQNIIALAQFVDGIMNEFPSDNHKVLYAARPVLTEMGFDVRNDASPEKRRLLAMQDPLKRLYFLISRTPNMPNEAFGYAGPRPTEEVVFYRNYVMNARSSLVNWVINLCQGEEVNPDIARLMYSEFMSRSGVSKLADLMDKFMYSKRDPKSRSSFNLSSFIRGATAEIYGTTELIKIGHTVYGVPKGIDRKGVDYISVETVEHGDGIMRKVSHAVQVKGLQSLSVPVVFNEEDIKQIVKDNPEYYKGIKIRANDVDGMRKLLDRHSNPRFTELIQGHSGAQEGEAIWVYAPTLIK